jgi:uncharacterized membrane protein
MKKNISKVAAVIMVSGFLYSCYYDKADILYNNGKPLGCDSFTTVSYFTNVKPILQAKCNSCHSGGSPSGGVPMGTYSTDKIIAANGKLFGTINHASGYSPMPQGEAKMDVCQITLIKKWIDAGSPNN